MGLPFNLMMVVLAVLCLSLADWRPEVAQICRSSLGTDCSHSEPLGRFSSTKLAQSSMFAPILRLTIPLAQSFLASGKRGAGIIFAEAQYRPEWPSKSLQQEIFLLNLEDGYFGCQVNESQDFLQLFELSRLCDGQAQCYLGTDEMVAPLKCNNRERCGSYQNSRGQQESVHCVNGVCLDGLCYCNDGFGGKSCDVPDENECKFRPCDVFAHCTNTMGSYYCSCFPGKTLACFAQTRGRSPEQFPSQPD